MGLFGPVLRLAQMNGSYRAFSRLCEPAVSEEYISGRKNQENVSEFLQGIDVAHSNRQKFLSWDRIFPEWFGKSPLGVGQLLRHS